MDEAGFDFRGPNERRPAKEFVPPPWEQDAFEELERKRRETQERQAAARPPVPQPETGERAAVAEAALQKAREHDGVRGEAEGAAENREPAAQRGPSEAQLMELMSALREEESEPPGHYARVATAVSILLMGFGTMVILWGMAALAKTGTAGVASKTAGAGLALFGSTFFASGVWMMYRNLKQRGVL